MVARHHKVVDTLSIQQNNNELTLNAGGEDKEVVNAVLPLFDESDADMKELITSRLYQILMTFNVMQNADTIFENSYFALMCNTFLYLISQPKSEWRNDLMNLLCKTLKITFSSSKWFKLFS